MLTSILLDKLKRIKSFENENIILICLSFHSSKNKVSISKAPTKDFDFFRLAILKEGKAV